jgi:hypothetical protein
MRESEQSGIARLPNGHQLRWEIKGGIGHIEPSTYHPKFGVSILNHCLVVKLIQSESKIMFRWL